MNRCAPVLALSIVLGTTSAPASPGPAATTDGAVDQSFTPPASAALVAPRPVPAYDGRPQPLPSARESLIWVPRAVLFPAHLVAEYVVRRPIVAAVRWGDEHYLWRRLHDWFTWDEGRSGVYPIANFEVGLRQTAGLTLFSRQWPHPDNSLKASLSVSDGLISLNGRDRLRVFRDGTGSLYLGGHFIERPDGVFYGVGPATRTEDRRLFSYLTRGVNLGLDGNLGGLNRAVVELAYRDVDLRSFADPRAPGFEDYRLLQPRLALVLDSRSPRLDVASGSGARLELTTGYALDPRDTGRQFMTWGGQAVAFWDLSGAGHVLALEVGAAFVENRGRRAVPFSELPSLGGTETMRGFLGGRLRGDSTITATVQYRYPFWTYLDAEIFSGVGNAFTGHLAGLRPSRLFASYGLALRTVFARDTSIALTLAAASRRFDDPEVDFLDTTRLSVGVTHGF
jgi:hypothetical protein